MKKTILLLFLIIAFRTEIFAGLTVPDEEFFIGEEVQILAENIRGRLHIYVYEIKDDSVSNKFIHNHHEDIEKSKLIYLPIKKIGKYEVLGEIRDVNLRFRTVFTVKPPKYSVTFDDSVKIDTTFNIKIQIENTVPVRIRNINLNCSFHNLEPKEYTEEFDLAPKEKKGFLIEVKSVRVGKGTISGVFDFGQYGKTQFWYPIDIRMKE